MRLSYRKIHTLKIFNVKILQVNTDYIEHSSEIEDENDDFYIALEKERIKRSK